MATTKRTDKPILNFIVDPVMLRRIDDYRYRNRFPTRAAAVKWLIEYAIKQNPRPDEEGRKPSGR